MSFDVTKAREKGTRAGRKLFIPSGPHEALDERQSSQALYRNRARSSGASLQEGKRDLLALRKKNKAPRKTYIHLRN